MNQNNQKSSLYLILFLRLVQFDKTLLITFMNKVPQPFNEQLFQDVFTLTQKIKTKMQPFLAKYKEQDMTWIMKSFEVLHSMFFDPNIDITLRFNSIFGIKFIFDTGDAILINLIEVYFLPKILQIASYDLKGPDDKRGVNYFLNNGYSKQTPDVQKFGYNYVRMASEFIFNAAIVKPHRLYESEPYNEPSVYSLALKALQDGGWKMYSTPAYYKQGTAKAIKALFDESLKVLDKSIQKYIDYFSVVFKKLMIEEKPPQTRLDPKKLIEFGDTFITANVVSLCDQLLGSNSLKNKKSALSMLNFLIKCGDIEAAHLVNCTDILDQLLYEVANGEINSRVLSRGKNLFKKSNANEQLKQQLYNELLKDIEYWSLCYPSAIKVKNRQSKIKMVHDELRSKLQIEFPLNRDLKEDKAIFDQRFKRNRTRNIKLLKELTDVDPQPQSFIAKKEVPPQAPTPVGSSYDLIAKEIVEVDNFINTLCDNQAKADPKINRILAFTQKYEAALQQPDLTNEQFDELIVKGQLVVQRINKITTTLQKYKNKQINFQQLTEIILNKKVSPKKQPQVKKEPQRPPEPVVASKLPTKEEKKVNQSASLPVISQDISSIKTEKQQEKFNRAQTLNQKPANASQAPKRQPEPISKIKNVVEQVTPIKIHQSLVKQQELDQQGILPSHSKHSIEKDPSYQSSVKKGTEQKQRVSIAEVIDIKPASHTIIKQEVQKQTQKVLFQESSRKIEKETVAVQHPRNVEVQRARQGQLEMEEEMNRELSREIEHKAGINIPHSFKNINGSHKGRNQTENFTPASIKTVRQAAQSEQQLLKASRASSRRSEKIKFQQSKVSVQATKQDEDDMIMMPDNNPLQNSFHELSGVEDFIKESKTLSFKKCFEDDKYLFGVQRNSKKFWLANDTVSLIKPVASRKQSRNKESSISIPDILNERNKKYQQELKYIEEKKDRKIIELESKIKVLENNGKALNQKIYEQERQIKQIRASSQADISRVKKNSILEDQDHIFKAKLATFQNKSVKEKTFYDDSSKKQPKYLDPLGRIINSRKYSQYFEHFQNEKQKKNLLKNKELLLKNDEIEFGCMTKREKDSLIVTFYITPSNDLDGLVTKVSQTSSLNIQVQPKHIPSIRKGKQQKVSVTVKVLQIPYSLPTIEFSYSLGHKLNNQQFFIPCSFHKYIYLNPVNQKQVSRKFERKDKILRGEEVPYSKKLLKNFESLSDYFPNGTLLNGGYPNDNGQVQYGGRAVWEGREFWVRIMVKLNQFLYVQAIADQQSQVPQFYISLVTNLLMKNIELKEM